MIQHTKEKLEKIVSESFSIADVLRKLNINVNGGNHRTIQSKIKIYEIDISHFTGASWNKGKTYKNNPSIKIKNKESILVENSIRRRSLLLRAMQESGVEYKCAECDLCDKWNENPLTLHIDHINGNNTDNRLENLRFLCPNCHQQTATWGNPYKKVKSERIKYIKKNTCLKCSKIIGRTKSGLCRECVDEKNRKVKNRPSKEELLKLLEEHSYLALSKMYGVSDNAIRKWLK